MHAGRGTRLRTLVVTEVKSPNFAINCMITRGEGIFSVCQKTWVFSGFFGFLPLEIKQLC